MRNYCPRTAKPHALGIFKTSAAIRAEEIVVGVRQRGGDLRFFHAKDATSKTLGKYIRGNISKDVALLMTDKLSAYSEQDCGWYPRQEVQNHQAISRTYVQGNLQRYLNEFSTGSIGGMKG